MGLFTLTSIPKYEPTPDLINGWLFNLYENLDTSSQPKALADLFGVNGIYKPLDSGVTQRGVCFSDEFKGFGNSSVGLNLKQGVSLANQVMVLQVCGFIYVPFSAEWTFYLGSDDGSLLYIDGNLIIDNDGLQSYTEKSASIELKRGYHPIVLLYRNAEGGASLGLQWSCERVLKRPINKQYIYHTRDLAVSFFGDSSSVSSNDFIYVNSLGFGHGSGGGSGSGGGNLASHYKFIYPNNSDVGAQEAQMYANALSYISQHNLISNDGLIFRGEVPVRGANEKINHSLAVNLTSGFIRVSFLGVRSAFDASSYESQVTASYDYTVQGVVDISLDSITLHNTISGLQINDFPQSSQNAPLSSAHAQILQSSGLVFSFDEQSHELLIQLDNRRVVIPFGNSIVGLCLRYSPHGVGSCTLKNLGSAV